MATVKDIAKILASRHKLKGADAERFLQQMVEVINAGLLSDRVVKIKGFGTFKLQAVKDRASVNVNTGERVVIEGHDKVTFTPDSVMKEIINKPFAQFETVVIDDDSPLLQEGFPTVDDDEEHDEDVISADEGEKTFVVEEQPAVVEEQSAAVEEQPAVVEKQPAVAEEKPAVMEEKPEVVEEKVPVDQEQPSTPVLPIMNPSGGTPVLKTENLTVLAENVTVVKEKAEEKDQGESTPPNTESIQEKSEPESVEPKNAIPDEVEPDKISSETENNIKTDDDTTTEEMEDNRFKYSGLLTNIAIAIIFFALGYWAGCTNVFSDIMPQRGQSHEDNVTVTHPKVMTDSDAAAPAVTKEAAKATTKEAAKTTTQKTEAPAAEKATANKPAQTAQPQKQEEKPLTQYNSDNRVKTGAYYIIGTETEVTVKEGQTLRSIAKAYLGPGMECYVEAYNGVKEVKPGQKVKIPKLKMKKIRK